MGANGGKPAGLRGSRKVKNLCASCLRYGWKVLCSAPDKAPKGVLVEKGAVTFCPFHWKGKAIKKKREEDTGT